MENGGLGAFFSRFHRDYYAGAFMVLIGSFAAYLGNSYRIGDLRHMGPGFFPVAVGVVIAAMGVLIAVGARGKVEDNADYLPPEWRGWFCICASIVAFIILGRWGGLLPATFAIVFISALGDKQNTWKGALVLAVAMCLIAVVVFWWALQLQFQLFSWGT